MAVSKRLRFEVLKRDGHTCRYCGRKPPEVVLQVDHVVPVTLGGENIPSNLVTACADCNAGKGSSMGADVPVPDISLDAVRWARAVEEAAADRRHHRDAEVEGIAAFSDAWIYNRMPDDWKPSVGKFARMGLSPADITHWAAMAAERTNEPDHCWRYFCKVCWSEVKAIRARAEAALTESAHPDDVEIGIPEIPVVREAEVDLTAPPWFDPTPQWEDHLCVECDERPAGDDGMCMSCRRVHYDNYDIGGSA